MNSRIKFSLLIFSFLILSTLLASQFEEPTQITNFPTNTNGPTFGPLIAGDTIAWYANPTELNRQVDYFIYDIPTGTTRQLTNHGGGFEFEGVPVLTEKYMAWAADATPGISTANYFFHDIATGVTTQITNFPTNTNGPTFGPLIAGDTIAWYANPTELNRQVDYFIYDIPTGTTRQLTNHGGGFEFAGAPVLTEKYMAWAADATPGISTANYFFHDIATGVTTQITNFPTNTNGPTFGPLIAGDTIAWYANPTELNRQVDYFIYDIPTGTTRQLTNHGGGFEFAGAPVLTEKYMAWAADATPGISTANYFFVPLPHTISQFSAGGTVTNLEGDLLIIQNNQNDDQLITQNGFFSFPPQDDGSIYSVTVQAQPSNPEQICSVTNGTGILDGENIEDIDISCETINIELNPNNFVFEDLDIGLTSTPQSLVIENISTIGITITDTFFLSNPPFDFISSDNNCEGNNLMQNESCTINISFSPTTTGIRRESLLILTDPLTPPFSAELLGTSGVVFFDDFEGSN